VWLHLHINKPINDYIPDSFDQPVIVTNRTIWPEELRLVSEETEAMRRTKREKEKKARIKANKKKSKTA